jgi:hypothetical protein
MPPGNAIADTIVFVGLFASVVLITKILVDNWTKRRMVAAHISDETIRALYAWDRDATALGALKWGLVLCGLGGALVLIQFLPYDFTDPIVYGLMLLLAGAGLILHYALLARVAQRRAAPPADGAGADPSTSPSTSHTAREEEP